MRLSPYWQHLRPTPLHKVAMAISIVPGSGRITLISSAQSSRPTFSCGSVNFAPSRAMHCEGEVQFTGDPGDSRAGWSVGWIQAQWIETNWAYYRGQHNSDGSIFLQRGRPPARPRQACRDTSGAVSTIFTDPTDPREFRRLPVDGTLPLRVNVQSNDPPGESYASVETNDTAGGRDNFIREIQLEFHFCTALSARDPDGNFHHLAHFYWNVHWQFRFSPTQFPPGDTHWRIEPIARGTSAAASRAFSGTPTDHRFAGVLTTTQASSCVDLASASANAVASPGPNRREFRVWQSVDVRH
jgi:hypothetical protein